MSRHVSIQIASVVIFVCSVVNLSVFLHLINLIWKNKFIDHSVSAAGKPSLCILIPEDNSFVWDFTLPDLVKSIEHQNGYVFSVLIGNNNNNSQNVSLGRFQWVIQRLPNGTALQFVHVHKNESVFQKLFKAGSSDGCKFYFTIDRYTRFVSIDWAGHLVSALRKLAPPYLGVVSPSGCVNCLFMHDTHREIFDEHQYPSDICWAEWMRSVYTPCHVSNVNSVVLHSFSNQSCGTDQPNDNNNISLLVARGRLRVNKFIALSSDKNSRSVEEESSVITRGNGK